MKRILSIIGLILCSFFLKAQTYPVGVNVAKASNQIGLNNAFQGKLILTTFMDTVSANQDCCIKNYDGALIKTISPVNGVFFRDLSNSTWVQLMPGGGGTGLQGWLLNYNTLLPSAYGNIGFGLFQNRGINFATNNTVRFSLDSTGILPAVGTVKLLGIDSVSGKLSYGTGGGGSSVTASNGLTKSSDDIKLGGTLTQQTDILGGGFDFSLQQANTILLNTISGSNTTNLDMGSNIGLQSTVSDRSSQLLIYSDSIISKPGLGNVKYDTLNNETSQNTLMGWTSTSGADRGKAGYVTLGSGLELFEGDLQSAGVTNVKNRTGQLYKGGSIYFFGDSYTEGSGASVPAKRWTSLLSTATGATEVNNGVAGTTLEKRVPIDYQASPNMVDDTVNIPYKTKDIKLLVIAFGLNDMGQTAAAYTTANYITDYTSVLNNATAKGWLSNEILLIPPYWIGQAGYNVYATITGNAAPTVARHESFVAATQTVSQTFGTMYVDIYTDQKNNDTTLIDADNIHPTDEGYAFIAADILQYLGAVQTPLSLTTVATPNNIAFQNVTNVTNVGTIWTTGSAGLYGNTGLSDTTFVGDRRIIFDGTSFGGFYGLNSANAQTPFAGMEVAMLLSNTDLYVNDNGVFSGSPVATIVNSDLISIVRNGSTFKVQSSSNNGLTWTDKYTFGYTSSAVHYIVTDICGTSCAHGAYTHGTVDNPTISDLTGSSYQDIEGALWFSKGIGAGVDAAKAYMNPTTGKLTFGDYGSGTHTGTPTYNLQVDASGNFIEGAVVSGSQWVTTGSDIYYSTGNVGIGAAPTAGFKLDISGTGYVNSLIRTSSSNGASLILKEPGSEWAIGVRPDLSAGLFAISDNAVGVRMSINSSGGATIASLAGTGTRMVEASSAGLLSATQIVTSSTYTPTLDNTTNVSSSTPIVCHYIRVGNQVTVTGSATLTTTAGGATATVLGISLPIASNFGATTDASGVPSATTGQTFANGMYIEGNSTSDRAELKFGAQAAASDTVFFTFVYTVI